MKSVCVCVCRKRLADCYLFGFYVSSPVDHSFVSCFLIGCFSFLAFECRAKKKRKKLPHETNRWQVFSFSNNKTNQPTGRATMNKKKSKKKRNETTSKEKRKDKKTRKSKENYGDPTNAGLIHCAVPVSLFVSSEICWPFFSHTIMSNTLLILVIRLLSKLLEVPSLLNVFPLIIIACFFFSKINFNFDSLSIWNAARKCVMRRTTKWRTKNRCGFCFVCFFFSLIVACCFAFLSPLMWR